MTWFDDGGNRPPYTPRGEYPHATDCLPYVVENVDTGEELAAAETWEGARLAAETLRREERVNAAVRPCYADEEMIA